MRNATCTAKAYGLVVLLTQHWNGWLRVLADSPSGQNRPDDHKLARPPKSEMRTWPARLCTNCIGTGFLNTR